MYTNGRVYIANNREEVEKLIYVARWETNWDYLSVGKSLVIRFLRTDPLSVQEHDRENRKI